MVLWLILFLLIIAISFLMAFRSMHDYHEIPQKSKQQYGLFLIRQIANLTPDMLDQIRKFMLEKELSISIERLVKGGKAALAVFGPKKILEKFSDQLDLLELEDYAVDISGKDMLIWEAGVKDGRQELILTENMFRGLPALSSEDQFLWQVILWAGDKAGRRSFQTQIRAAVLSKEPARRQAVATAFQNLREDLVKIPRPFSFKQMMDFYKLRSLSRDSKGPVLTSEALLRLLRIS